MTYQQQQQRAGCLQTAEAKPPTSLSPFTFAAFEAAGLLPQADAPDNLLPLDAKLKPPAEDYL